MPRSLAIRRNIAGVRKKVERRREREREKDGSPVGPTASSQRVSELARAKWMRIYASRAAARVCKSVSLVPRAHMRGALSLLRAAALNTPLLPLSLRQLFLFLLALFLLLARAFVFFRPSLSLVPTRSASARQKEAKKNRCTTSRARERPRVEDPIKIPDWVYSLCARARSLPTPFLRQCKVEQKEKNEDRVKDREKEKRNFKEFRASLAHASRGMGGKHWLLHRAWPTPTERNF